VCDGKTLGDSAVENDDGIHGFVAQLTIYARALGVALTQKTYDTSESSERAALQELLVHEGHKSGDPAQPFFFGTQEGNPPTCTQSNI
jgi:hypothetical protein